MLLLENRLAGEAYGRRRRHFRPGQAGPPPAGSGPAFGRSGAASAGNGAASGGMSCIIQVGLPLGRVSEFRVSEFRGAETNCRFEFTQR